MIDNWHASFEDTTHIFEEIEHSFISRAPLDWSPSNLQIYHHRWGQIAVNMVSHLHKCYFYKASLYTTGYLVFVSFFVIKLYLVIFPAPSFFDFKNSILRAAKKGCPSPNKPVALVRTIQVQILMAEEILQCCNSYLIFLYTFIQSAQCWVLENLLL
mgnify:CR=1 FL=1